ncbi:MAG: hypothetical protein LBQ63_06825 [Deltaproteobacteria bacterium]|jgi:hypothetical protein|nr:hypothetical protein [Deltaproteobacteria bacterium]
MPKHRVELFGQIIYAPELSYDALLDLENGIKASAAAILEDFQAEFITFESEGDRTFFQCVFPDCDAGMNERIAGRFIGKMNPHLECKLLFVDRMLYRHWFHALTHRGGIRKEINLPEAGPIDKALASEDA